MVKELTELREARDIFLEETTALNTRNEQLADLNAQITAQIQNVLGDPVTPAAAAQQTLHDLSMTSAGPDAGSSKASLRAKKNDKTRYSPSVTSFSTIGTNSTYEISEEPAKSSRDTKSPASEHHAHQKKFGWLRGAAGGVTSSKMPPPPAIPEKGKGHNFASANVLRITRCDHCGDKLWGAQMKCSSKLHLTQ